MRELVEGALVVVPAEPALGLARLERFVDDGSGGRAARLFLYESGSFVVRPRDAVIAAPPGVWPPGGPAS